MKRQGSERDDFLADAKSLLSEFLKGGFAPNVILLREFDYNKAGVMLEGLHFSAWILLGHIRERHRIFYKFMQDIEQDMDTWPPAYWPENYQPRNREEWDRAIDEYENELQEMINFVTHPDTDLLKKNKEGKNVFWAAVTVLHHTGYHIGQLKTIGRQLGVWVG